MTGIRFGRAPALLVAAALLLATALLAFAAPEANTTAADTKQAANGTPRQCPPLGFNAVANLNLSAYISAPWFVQQQLPVSFSGEDPLLDLFCVRARYIPFNASALGQGLQVVNYANRGRVNGPAQGTSGAGDNSTRLNQFRSFPLSAVPDPSATSTPQANSKLLVGPRFLIPGLIFGQPRAREAFGEYWIVAVGSRDADRKGDAVASQYDWAIISGGPPRFTLPNGCSVQSAEQLSAALSGRGGSRMATRDGSGSSTGSGRNDAGMPRMRSAGEEMVNGLRDAHLAIVDGIRTAAQELRESHAAFQQGKPLDLIVPGSAGEDTASSSSSSSSAMPTNERDASSTMMGGGSMMSRAPRGGNGLWLFSRKPVDPTNTARMRDVAVALGYDIAGLLPVQQANCTYVGADP